LSLSPSSFLRARPTLLFLVAAVLLPNLLFVAGMLIGIGTPPRPVAILLYTAVAIMARFAPRPVTLAAYLAVLVHDVFGTVGAMFNLVTLELLSSVKFSSRLDPMASGLYLALGALLLGATMSALWLLLREREALRRASLVLPVLLVAALAAGDAHFNALPHYKFGSALAKGQPFESAVRESGFETAILSGPPRNVLLVIVEGMGVFETPAQQALVVAPLTALEKGGRYAVSMGTTTYYGSTTASEMRELCASRAPYTDHLDHPAPDCLPWKLAARGMDTVGFHGFSGGMFDRARWWPHLGFGRTLFGDTLTGLPQCGGVFRGACDTAAAATVARTLREASRPVFFYWLTLNTHIPIEPDEHSGALDCTDGGIFGDGEVCDMAGMWRDVLARIADMAADPAMPPMDILVVGDHAPPFLDRTQRTMFIAGAVTWIRLAPREP
jgi:hypothetical protein